MSSGLLTILLFVPFLVALAIIEPIYLRSGFKRGIWRALISLGATVVAIFVSLLVANMLAGFLAGPVTRLIQEDAFDSMGVMRGLAKSMISGIVQDGLALLLFGIFFLICLIVLKIVVNHICPGKLQVAKKGLKWGGLGVRVVDTFLVAILILLPIYGTIATYVTPAASLAKYAAKENSQVVMLLNKAADHPVVGMYKYGPANWVYKGLSGFKVGDANVDLPKIAETVNITVQKLDKFKNAEGEDRIQAAKELTQYLRSNVVEEEWFYEVAKETSIEFEKQIEQATSPEEAREAKMYLDLFSAPEEEFKDSFGKILDFFAYALDSEYMDFGDTGDYAVLTTENYAKLADMLNYSTQTKSIKQMTLVSAAEILYRTQYQALGVSANDQTVNAAATAFVEQYWNNGSISKDQANAEAAAIVILYTETDSLAILEGFARHPLFGYEAIESFVTDEFVAAALVEGEDVAQLSTVLAQNPSIRQEILEYLKNCKTRPAAKELLDDYAVNVVKNVIQ